MFTPLARIPSYFGIRVEQGQFGRDPVVRGRTVVLIVEHGFKIRKSTQTPHKNPRVRKCRNGIRRIELNN